MVLKQRIRHIFVIVLVIISTYVNAQYMLHIQIEEIKTDKGFIMLALFNNESDFPNKNAFKVDSVKAIKGEVNLKLSNIPGGTYAIAVYHDENSNGELDKNMIGIPTESFGFSWKDDPKFTRPSWTDMRFTISGDKKMVIPLVN